MLPYEKKGNRTKRCIYIAKFSDHFLYVGLTWNPKERWSVHLTDENSAIYLHEQETGLKRKRLGITVFQPRLKVCTFARTNYYEYGKQRQVQESP